MSTGTARARFDAVCFDCDSTLSRIEGIDELAKRAGCEAEIAALTKAAMNGEVPLDAVYGKRLERVRPGRADLDWLAQRYVEEMVPGARETILTLVRLGKPAYVVSGGILQPVITLAGGLGIPAERVRAVPVVLDADGRYAGFDPAEPLARSEGKALVCAEVAKKHGRLALVGDGASDVAARSAGAFIVGFGGVVARDAVRKTADVFILDPSLTAVLDALLTEEERALV